MLHSARGIKNTLLLISDLDGEIIGYYQEEEWRVSSCFYGNSNCCVFSMSGGKIEVFPPSFQNTSYVMANNEMLVVGGGNRHAIALNENMRQCSTGECITFKSKPLSYLCDFECAVVELWKLV